jgi:hypothetical protein
MGAAFFFADFSKALAFLPAGWNSYGNDSWLTANMR